LRIEYHPKIESELRHIIQYYNKCVPSLGYQFLDNFEQQIRFISKNPRSFLVIKNDIRKAVLNRFPFVLYFKIVNEDILRITVIKHQRRHPGFGMNRN